MDILQPPSLRRRFSGTSVGTWLSLVEHSLGVGGVSSSNLLVPTNHSCNFSFGSRYPCQSGRFCAREPGACYEFLSTHIFCPRLDTCPKWLAAAGRARRQRPF